MGMRRFVLALLLSVPAWSYAQTTPLTFAIVPQQAAGELARRWAPIVQYLSEQTGLALQFRTAKDLPTFQNEMRNGVYDIAFINSYYYAQFSKTAGYHAFATERAAKFVGVVVAHRDSGLIRLSDLAKKPVAFASPTAVTSMQAYTELKNQQINVMPVYVVSMDSVYRSVAKGMFPAGVGELRTLNSIDPEVRANLRTIWAAPPLPPFTFSAHPRVARADIEKLQRAMIEMSENAKGIALLKAVNMKGIDAADERDYESVRNLRLIADNPPAS